MIVCVYVCVCTYEREKRKSMHTLAHTSWRVRGLLIHSVIKDF